MVSGLGISGILADKNDGLWFPEQASTFAAESDSAFFMILWTDIGFFALILIFMTAFVLLYRKKKGGKATSRVTHNNLLEITWSIVPCFFILVMFIRGSFGFLDMNTPPEGATQVNVKAFKWNWTMDYGDAAFHPELHVVVNQPTKLVMRSSDVLHSFFVPAFRIKRDIVPGRYNVTWFEATVVSEQVSEEELAKALQETEENGGQFDYDYWDFTPDGYRYYDIFCAEYCGRDHSTMQSYLVVHETQEDLDAWIKKIKVRDPGTSLADHGKKLYNQRGCAGCHSIDGASLVGPTFKDLFGGEHPLKNGATIKVDEGHIRESILEPKAKIYAGFQPVMPPYKGQLTDDDIDSLIAYLREISKHAPVTPSNEDSAKDRGTDDPENQPNATDESHPANQ